jgi:HAD domain in Swiss Army Knife RNA repair proteins
MPGQTKIWSVFDPVAVSLVNNLCEEHGWKVVLHSSWVRIMGGKNTYDHCVSQGIKAENFHEDAWCDENIDWRYTRVAKWLKEHPDVTTYAMVDDEPYKWDDNPVYPHPAGMSLHLVLVDYYDGFLFNIYNEIRAKGRDDDVRA